MPSLTVKQSELATRLLAYEAAAGGADAHQTAAARIHDRLHEQLSPLVGEAGVQALLVRSAKLVQGEFAEVARASIFEGAARLREVLAAPALAREPAIALFGNFLTLLTTFIGERLTIQVLRRAWPALETQGPAEKTP